MDERHGYLSGGPNATHRADPAELTSPCEPPNVAAANTDLYQVVRRHWVVVLCLTAAAAALGGMYSRLAQTTYCASAQLKIGRDAPPLIGPAPTGPPAGQFQGHVLTQCQVLKSPRILAMAMEDPKTPRAGSPSRLLAWLKSSLRVRPVEGSHIVELSLEGPRPEQTADLLNAVIEAYLRYRRTQRQETARRHIRVLDQQRDRLAQSLERIQQRMLELQARHELVSADPAGPSVGQDRLREIDLALTKAQIDMTQYEAEMKLKLRYTRREWRSLAMVEPVIRAELGPVENKLIGARQKLASLQTHLGQKHRDVVRAGAEVDVLQQAADGALLHAAQDLMTHTCQQYQVARARYQSLRLAFDRCRRRVLAHQSGMNRYLALKADQARTHAMYQNVARRVEEMRAVSASASDEPGNIEVLHFAAPSEGTDTPRSKSFVIAGALLGLACSLVVVMALERTAGAPIPSNIRPGVLPDGSLHWPDDPGDPLDRPAPRD